MALLSKYIIALASITFVYKQPSYIITSLFKKEIIKEYFKD
ncbi:hypothetical protein A0O32_1424 [Anoxybacillus flavithermus]|uniref:Uncharacterized protein n=1 Tax=Anoxybacillus flavithermus TaxID=33934 RepID=A0A178TH27_9BACL|nr:hypothetical protein TAF16_1716 [Anoxybacillus flavithermus]OAO80567.1 hypothetical protein A0O32_1424 [Anoxybacillus flavithermus]